VAHVRRVTKQRYAIQLIAAMKLTFDLVIAGIQKAGTTSLAHFLAQHPAIVGHDTREMPYFVRDALYARDFESVFRDYYPQGVAEAQCVLAKSVGISFDPQAAHRLQAHSPGCKVVVSLRDPVARAYSAYWYMRRMGWETKPSFEAALQAEAERSMQSGTVATNCSYRARGIYHEQIERLQHLFGDDQVRVFLLEDLKTNPVATCQQIFGFVGVDPSFRPAASESKNTAKQVRAEWVSRLLTRVAEGQHVLKDIMRLVIPSPLAKRVRRIVQRWNETHVSPPPMREDTRQALAKYFAPHNRKLETLLGRSLRHWTWPRDDGDTAAPDDATSRPRTRRGHAS